MGLGDAADEQGTSFFTMQADSTEPEAFVEWESGRPINIAIRDGWSERVSPSELLHEVQSQVLQHATGRQRYQPSLKDVPLKDLREFANLIREAREERHRAPSDAHSVKSYHFVAEWTGGRLLGLTCTEPDWMLETTRARIADELLDVCTPPEEAPEGPAQRRLLRFVGKG